MKPFLIFSLTLLMTLNANGQFYGSASIGYPQMNYEIPTYTLLTNAEIYDLRLNPTMTIGIGKKFKSKGRLNLNLVSDISLFTAKANYFRTQTWMSVTEGIMSFRLMRWKLNPNFNLRITKRASLDLGFLFVLNASFHGLNGTETTFGYIDFDGDTEVLPFPITLPSSTAYLNTPIINSGFSTAINYKINTPIEVFVRYTFDRNKLDKDFMEIQTFSSGINYYFNHENQ